MCDSSSVTINWAASSFSSIRNFNIFSARASLLKRAGFLWSGAGGAMAWAYLLLWSFRIEIKPRQNLGKLSSSEEFLRIGRSNVLRSLFWLCSAIDLDLWCHTLGMLLVSTFLYLPIKSLILYNTGPSWAITNYTFPVGFCLMNWRFEICCSTSLNSSEICCWLSASNAEFFGFAAN